MERLGEIRTVELLGVGAPAVIPALKKGSNFIILVFSYGEKDKSFLPLSPYVLIRRALSPEIVQWVYIKGF